MAYRDIITKRLHLALVRGDIDAESPTLVRVHVRNTLGDVLQLHDRDLGLPVAIALKELATADSGVLVVLGDDETAETILGRIAGDLADPADNGAGGQASTELRNYGIGAQILSDLGVGKMRVLSAPKVFHGLKGFGLEVVEYVEPSQ